MTLIRNARWALKRTVLCVASALVIPMPVIGRASESENVGLDSKDRELIDGPDLTKLRQFKLKPGDRPSSLLLPFTAGASLVRAPNATVGSMFFSDTLGGLRINASVRGLKPGIYELRLDEHFHGPTLDATCANTTTVEDSEPPTAWRIGPLTAEADGSARFERVFAGISIMGGPYSVPKKIGGPSRAKPEIVIDQREFGVYGRKLTLHKRDPNGHGLSEPLACAIVYGAPPYASATISPLAKFTASGRISFQQGEDSRATMTVDLKRLPPGTYRLVVHEFADCANAVGGVGDPYRPEANPLITQPHYPWPLKDGLLGTFATDKRGALRAAKRFSHPLTSGSPHTIRDRAVVIESVAPDPATGKSIAVGCGIVGGP